MIFAYSFMIEGTKHRQRECEHYYCNFPKHKYYAKLCEMKGYSLSDRYNLGHNAINILQKSQLMFIPKYYILTYLTY